MVTNFICCTQKKVSLNWKDLNYQDITIIKTIKSIKLRTKYVEIVKNMVTTKVEM